MKFTGLVLETCKCFPRLITLHQPHFLSRSLTTNTPSALGVCRTTPLPQPTAGTRGRHPDSTSERHPSFVALPQPAGRAVFPSELVDGAVVPAGTGVFLFTYKC